MYTFSIRAPPSASTLSRIRCAKTSHGPRRRRGGRTRQPSPHPSRQQTSAAGSDGPALAGESRASVPLSARGVFAGAGEGEEEPTRLALTSGEGADDGGARQSGGAVIVAMKRTGRASSCASARVSAVAVRSHILALEPGESSERLDSWWELWTSSSRQPSLVTTGARLAAAA